MDMILSFLGGIVGSWLFFFAVFFFAIISEKSDRLGWSVFLGIAALASAFILVGVGGLPQVNLWVLGVAYVVLGFTHSVWRWFRWTSIVTQRFNKLVDQHGGKVSDYVLRDYNTELDYTENLDRIAYWVLAWPVSGAAYMVGDIVVVIKNFITTFMSKIFIKISENAKKKANLDIAKIE